MEQLTLDQAAANHALYKAPVQGEQYAIAGFKAGAEWQKQQSKELINLMRQLLAAYDFRYPDIRPLLVGYTNEQAFEKMNNLIERLQD